MSAIYPNAYDNLNLMGILPYDVNEIVEGKPSEYLKEHGSGIYSLPNDSFEKSEHGEKKKINVDWKKLGLAAIGTYLLGALLSRSSNPIKGGKAIGKLLKGIVTLPLKVFKK